HRTSGPGPHARRRRGGRRGRLHDVARPRQLHRFPGGTRMTPPDDGRTDLEPGVVGDIDDLDASDDEVAGIDDELIADLDDDPGGDWSDEADDDESHRGAFGDFGGSTRALIERTFRERIIIVGVTLSGGDPEQTDADLDELALLVDTAGADVV